MGLDYAIDELYSTGWTPLDTSGCLRHNDGRSFPTVDRAREEFKSAGFDLSVRYIQLFDCHRAEWRDLTGVQVGGVVGSCADEAAVYALAQLRRKSMAAATTV